LNCHEAEQYFSVSVEILSLKGLLGQMGTQVNRSAKFRHVDQYLHSIPLDQGSLDCFQKSKA
jgi:hypothetical protein